MKILFPLKPKELKLLAKAVRANLDTKNKMIL
jgi:hypothetical protein